jgi:hypothetical protein
MNAVRQSELWAWRIGRTFEWERVMFYWDCLQEIRKLGRCCVQRAAQRSLLL